MTKILIATIAATALLTGCGHNIGTAFHGKVFNVGYDPELNKFGVQYYNGAMVTGLQKELSSTKFSYKDTSEKDGIQTISELNYESANGEQVTGYRVELEEAKNQNKQEVSNE